MKRLWDDDELTTEWTLEPRIKPRARPIARALPGNRLAFVGGLGDLYSTPSRSQAVDIYDAAAGTIYSTQLPQQHDNVSVAASGSSLFVAGGGSDAVDVYDADAGQWSSTNLSAARNHLTAAAVESGVLFAGGQTDDGQYSDIVDLLNTTTGEWSVANLSQPRVVDAMATVGSQVVLAAGAWGTNGLDIFEGSAVDIYDDATGAWTSTALSEARSGIGQISDEQATTVDSAAQRRSAHHRSAVVDTLRSNRLDNIVLGVVLDQSH